VKVVWTREDDIKFDYYNAVASMYMKRLWALMASQRRGCNVGVPSDYFDFLM